MCSSKDSAGMLAEVLLLCMLVNNCGLLGHVMEVNIYGTYSIHLHFSLFDVVVDEIGQLKICSWFAAIGYSY